MDVVMFLVSGAVGWAGFDLVFKGKIDWAGLWAYCSGGFWFWVVFNSGLLS